MWDRRLKVAEAGLSQKCIIGKSRRVFLDHGIGSIVLLILESSRNKVKVEINFKD